MEKEVNMYLFLILILARKVETKYLDFSDDEGYFYSAHIICDSIVKNYIYTREYGVISLIQDLDILASKYNNFLRDTIDQSLDISKMEFPCFITIELILPKYYDDYGVNEMIKKAIGVKFICYRKKLTEEEIETMLD